MDWGSSFWKIIASQVCVAGVRLTPSCLRSESRVVLLRYDRKMGDTLASLVIAWSLL